MGTAYAGNNTSIYLCGQPVSMVDESMAPRGSSYWVSNSSKRIISPKAPVVIKDGGSPVSPDDYTVSHLTSMVTFDTAPAGPVTMTADYLPSYEVGTAKSINYVRERVDLDSTPFGAVGAERILGLADVSGSIEMFQLTDTPIGSGEKSFIELIEDAEATVLRLQPTDSPGVQHWAWVLFSEEEISSAPDDIVETTLNYVGDQQQGTNKLFDVRN